MPAWDSEVRPALAYVNRGRWVADCPFRCPGVEGTGSELARGDWFICRNCLNAAVDGQRLPLLWPPAEHVRAIEAALAVRDVDHQNWNLNESIGALMVENVEHGLFDRLTGAVAGDVGCDHAALPALAALGHTIHALPAGQ